MTCHPKYYSYIGLVAPQDKKAVYMGYAFLYGVIGSLVGSNVGGEMYNSFLKPLVGQAGVTSQLRTFWIVFAALGVLTMFLLILYNKVFGEDTHETRTKARRVMIIIYIVLIGLSVAMPVFVVSTKGAIPLSQARYLSTSLCDCINASAEENSKLNQPELRLSDAGGGPTSFSINPRRVSALKIRQLTGCSISCVKFTYVGAST